MSECVRVRVSVKIQVCGDVRVIGRCSVLYCVAVCCSVLQRVVVCCSERF